MPALPPATTPVFRHATGLVDGWRAIGRTPSEAMFRAAFMATSRLGLPADEAATAMLQLLCESFEVLHNIAQAPPAAQGPLPPSADPADCRQQTPASATCATRQLLGVNNICRLKRAAQCYLITFNHSQVCIGPMQASARPQVLQSEPSNGVMRLASGCIASLGHPGASLRLLVYSTLVHIATVAVQNWIQLPVKRPISMNRACASKQSSALQGVSRLRCHLHLLMQLVPGHVGAMSSMHASALRAHACSVVAKFHSV